MLELFEISHVRAPEMPFFESESGRFQNDKAFGGEPKDIANSWAVKNPNCGVHVNRSFHKILMWKTLVLLERIELSTSPLPRECSTSEL